MEHFFKRVFGFSTRAIIALAVIGVISFFGLAATEGALFGFLTMLGFCGLPLAVLAFVVSGIGLMAGRFNTQQKAKRHYDANLSADDSKRMRRILAQLSPKDRDYLRERLEEREMGIGDDGEMVALDDLMAQFEEKLDHKEKRS